MDDIGRVATALRALLLMDPAVVQTLGGMDRQTLARLSQDHNISAEHMDMFSMMFGHDLQDHNQQASNQQAGGHSGGWEEGSSQRNERQVEYDERRGHRPHRDYHPQDCDFDDNRYDDKEDDRGDIFSDRDAHNVKEDQSGHDRYEQKVSSGWKRGQGRGKYQGRGRYQSREYNRGRGRGMGRGRGNFFQRGFFRRGDTNR